MATAKETPAFDAKEYIRHLTRRPGVYQMYGADGKLLYVGKAKNLKNRVASYFRATGLNNKTVALVGRIARIDVTVTRSETEALLLEQSLIKANRPPYNILLRDDKSYPYIYLSTDQEYPRLTFHRGAKRGKGRYFGPYPGAGAVRESLSLLQKVFRVRQCEDTVFANRSRPCLQYQIGRCTAPCVGFISPEEYAGSVRHTEMFLEGKGAALIDELAGNMEQASRELEFERAAEIRDQIAALQRILHSQHIEGESGDVDILAIAAEGPVSCVQVMFVRAGRILGSKSFYPDSALEEPLAEVLAGFIGQYYLSSAGREIPRELLVNVAPSDAAILADALAEKVGRQVQISHRVRGGRARWLALALGTAEQNCQARLASRDSIRDRLRALGDALGMDEAPERLECFDISHTGGEKTVASCVVFGEEGPLKSDYRRFNIDGIEPGDDYAAMAQALSRRYKRLQEGEGKLPDILVIDGGKGQMRQAREALDELAVTGVTLLGIAKGPTRKAGLERLYVGENAKEISLSPHAPALHLLQQIRDEAHRFAITGHKGRRDKSRRTSALENISGVGPKRRRDLLRYFGGMRELQQATVDDLRRVPGISGKMAGVIHDALHGE